MAVLSALALRLMCRIDASAALPHRRHLSRGLNDLLVTSVRILQLIAMLGTFYAYSGLAVALTGGAATGRVPDCLIEWGRGQFATVPLPFLTTGLPAVVIAAVLLGWTVWGRWVYATGRNEASARLCAYRSTRANACICDK